jgi:hypothetical protein
MDDQIEAVNPGPKPSLEEIEKSLKEHPCDPQWLCGPLPPDEVHARAQQTFSYREKQWNELEALRVERQTMRQRFAAYLLATGAMTDATRSEAAFGLAIAMKQGRQSSRQCFATLESCYGTLSQKWSPPGQQSQQPTPPSQEELLAKMKELKACLNADATGCAKSQRCQQPDSLPF